MVKTKEDNKLWMKIKYHVDRGIPMNITYDDYYRLNDWHNNLGKNEKEDD